jgi:hypothetical protein
MPAPFMSSLMAEPPKMVNHTAKTSVGTPRTPRMNCRMVRPLEI